MAAVWLQLALAPLAAVAATIFLLKLVLPAALLGPSRACTLSAAYLWFYLIWCSRWAGDEAGLDEDADDQVCARKA